MNSALAALLGLAVAIVLIIRKVSPVYGLMLGALIGGIAAGYPLLKTVDLMISGIEEIIPAVIRILSAGVLSGVLIRTAVSDIKVTNNRATQGVIVMKFKEEGDKVISIALTEKEEDDTSTDTASETDATPVE